MNDMKINRDHLRSRCQHFTNYYRYWMETHAFKISSMTFDLATPNSSRILILFRCNHVTRVDNGHAKWSLSIELIADVRPVVWPLTLWPDKQIGITNSCAGSGNIPMDGVGWGLINGAQHTFTHPTPSILKDPRWSTCIASKWILTSTVDYRLPKILDHVPMQSIAIWSYLDRTLTLGYQNWCHFLL